MSVAALFLCLAGTAAVELPGEDIISLFEARKLVYTGGEYTSEEFQYRLLKPRQIEPGRKYPVILFLHGAGERGADNKAQLKYLPEWLASDENREKYPCFLIVPQCRSERKWSNVNWSAPSASDLPAEPSDQMQAAVKILDLVLQEFPCDVDRVYLTGISMGGYGSWDLAERMPQRFAAVVPVCGGGDPKHADRLVNVPVWAWHGDADKAVPVARSREMIAAIQAAGGHPKYTELPGVGHNSWVQAYHEPGNVLPWLFAQVRKPTAP